MLKKSLILVATAFAFIVVGTGQSDQPPLIGPVPLLVY